MTKKHFEALAWAFARTRPPVDLTIERQQWADDLAAVADVCASANVNFHRGRFYAACSEYGAYTS